MSLIVRYSERCLITTHGLLMHNKRYFQIPQHGMQRPAHAAVANQGGKTRYKVPKTWRKTFEMIRETKKKNPEANRKALKYAALITFAFFGSVAGFVKFLHFFGPGGGGRSWRQSIWIEVANKETDKAFEQMEQESSEGYIRNMFGLGMKPKMATLEERAKMISEDRYRTWEDVMSKGFPRNAEEYKKVSKMRPETLDDYEIIDNLEKKSQDGRKLTNAQ